MSSSRIVIDLLSDNEDEEEEDEYDDDSQSVVLIDNLPPPTRAKICRMLSDMRNEWKEQIYSEFNDGKMIFEVEASDDEALAIEQEKWFNDTLTYDLDFIQLWDFFEKHKRILKPTQIEPTVNLAVSIFFVFGVIPCETKATALKKIYNFFLENGKSVTCKLLKKIDMLLGYWDLPGFPPASHVRIACSRLRQLRSSVAKLVCRTEQIRDRWWFEECKIPIPESDHIGVELLRNLKHDLEESRKRVNDSSIPLLIIVPFLLLFFNSRMPVSDPEEKYFRYDPRSLTSKSMFPATRENVLCLKEFVVILNKYSVQRRQWNQYLCNLFHDQFVSGKLCSEYLSTETLTQEQIDQRQYEKDYPNYDIPNIACGDHPKFIGPKLIMPSIEDVAGFVRSRQHNPLKYTISNNTEEDDVCIVGAGSSRGKESMSSISQLSRIYPIRCCLTTEIMSEPARSIFCTHESCFELRSFLIYSNSLPDEPSIYIMQCPICKKKFRPHDLFIDRKLQSIINSCSDDEDDRVMDLVGDSDNDDDDEDDEEMRKADEEEERLMQQCHAKFLFNDANKSKSVFTSAPRPQQLSPPSSSSSSSTSSVSVIVAPTPVTAPVSMNSNIFVVGSQHDTTLQLPLRPNNPMRPSLQQPPSARRIPILPQSQPSPPSQSQLIGSINVVPRTPQMQHLVSNRLGLPIPQLNPLVVQLPVRRQTNIRSSLRPNTIS